MSGALWGAGAGMTFGLFQTLNRQALRGMDAYVSTFLQLVVSATVLLGASLVAEDVARVWDAPASATINFALAGLLHFFVGWTLLNLSQKRIGAARTSPLIGTTPLWGTLIATVALGELPELVTLIGVALTVSGVYLVSAGRDRAAAEIGSEAGFLDPGALKGSAFGLATALCWAASPVFTRAGLRDFDSPLLGVTIGMVAAAIAYGLALLLRQARVGTEPIAGKAMTVKLAAGILVGVATWMRWVSLSLVPVAMVLALGQLSIPTVMVLAPRVVGRSLERITPQVVAGAAVIVAGSLILIFQG